MKYRVYIDSLGQPITPAGEYKVHTGENEFHYLIVDEKGNETVLQRGTEYLDYKIKQQNK